MENKNQPAFPPNAGWEHSEAIGLTKREYFAAKVMQGWIASFAGVREIPDPEVAARKAVALADALLVELEK